MFLNYCTTVAHQMNTARFHCALPPQELRDLWEVQQKERKEGDTSSILDDIEDEENKEFQSLVKVTVITHPMHCVCPTEHARGTAP